MANEQETQETQTTETATTDTSLVNEQAKTEETKVEETTAEEKKTESAEETKFVPLTAEDLKFPEGMSVDDAARDDFLGILNNREMTPAQQAQALVDLQAKVATQASEAGSQAWTTLQETWVKDVKADPDIGGAKLEPALASIGKLIESHGSPELRAVMDLTGAGNNVHVIKFLSNIAKSLTEGGHVSGTPGSTEQSVADLLYPTMKKGS